jgi:hypothetical protein
MFALVKTFFDTISTKMMKTFRGYMCIRYIFKTHGAYEVISEFLHSIGNLGDEGYDIYWMTVS